MLAPRPGYLLRVAPLLELVLLLELLASEGRGADSSPSGPSTFLPGVDPSDPGEVCESTMRYTPPSGVRAISGSPPFRLRTNTDKYIPGQAIQVSVNPLGPDTYGFRGVILQVRNFSTQQTIGHFAEPTPARTGHHIYNCAHEADTIVTWYDHVVNTTTVTWQSPSVDSVELGTVQLIATLFNETSYWTSLVATQLRKGFASIDLDTCGITKGCFRYPKEGSTSCQPDTCEYLATYRRVGENAEFELSASAGWAAIGFSSDDKMGGDDVMMCVRTRSSAEVRHYFNLAHQPPTLLQNPPFVDKHVEVSDVDGEVRVSCRFRRPLKIANDHAASNVDLQNDWHQLYAWGPVSTSGVVMKHSMDRPPVSEGKITLNPRRDVTGGARPGGQPATASLIAASIFVFLMRMLVITPHSCTPGAALLLGT